MVITIVWGTRMVGVVDRVPGRFHVATRFFHLWWVPLFPLRTFVVSEIDDDNRVQLPLSAYSFVMAWLRLGLVLAGHYYAATGAARVVAPHLGAGAWKWGVLLGALLAIGGLIIDLATEWKVIAHVVIAAGLTMVFAPLAFLSSDPYALPIGAGLLVLAWLTVRLTRASDARAAELAEIIGISMPPPAATVHVQRPPAPPAPIAPLRTEAPPAREAAPEQPRVLR